MGSAEAFGYQFRGRNIVNATVTSLVQKHGLGGTDRFLFGGCSAGGAGAVVQIDAVSSLLDSLGASSVDLRGFFDASAWPDLPGPPWLAGNPTAAEPLVQTVQQLSQFIAPAYSPACAAANPGNEYLCIYPSTALQFVQTPFLLNAAQFDSFYFVRAPFARALLHSLPFSPPPAWSRRA